MKRTKYFLNILSVTPNVKRVKGNDVTFFSDTQTVWMPSVYTANDLVKLPAFKRITRDEARKTIPKAFR